MRVEYRSNENSTAANDFFIVKVLVGDKIYLEERFTITVYPESYWDGLQIGSNNTLLGETEDKNICIVQYVSDVDPHWLYSVRIGLHLDPDPGGIQ